jgi:RimJ/RimL family protein N-acetyltransferase
MSSAPATYAIRVEGHLADHWSAWLGGLEMIRDEDGTTTVTVPVADQAQLHGVLAGLRDIGAVISELRRLEPIGVHPDPARPATTVVVTLGHAAEAPVIGALTLRREDAPAELAVDDRARDRQAELRWVLGPAHTGHGYATEAVRELLRHSFQDLGLHRFTASCLLADDASRRLMERVGMRRELHAVAASLHRSGRWLDTVGYALLEEEWATAAHR